MTKLDFLFALQSRLEGLPKDEVRERIGFYAEMIEDRMEEGNSEEAAVAAVGSVEEIAAQIAADLGGVPAEKPRTPMKAWEIVLLVLGAPVWVPLALSALAVVLSLYASLWALIISLWAVFASLAACGVAALALAVGFLLTGKAAEGLAVLGAGLVLVALSLFVLWGCKAATAGAVLLTKKPALWLKDRFAGKERVV